jgi:hypothetical protein
MRPSTDASGAVCQRVSAAHDLYADEPVGEERLSEPCLREVADGADRAHRDREAAQGSERQNIREGEEVSMKEAMKCFVRWFFPKSPPLPVKPKLLLQQEDALQTDPEQDCIENLVEDEIYRFLSQWDHPEIVCQAKNEEPRETEQNKLTRPDGSFHIFFRPLYQYTKWCECYRRFPTSGRKTGR